MVRNYKATIKKNYTEDDSLTALNAVNDGLNIDAASKTLKNRHLGLHKGNKRGRRPIFSKEEEDDLVMTINNLADWSEIYKTKNFLFNYLIKIKLFRLTNPG
jgi:hypothetical protein